MPRLTLYDYLNHRQFLGQLWAQDEGGSFAVLPRQQQLDLHDYYAPSVPLADQQALTHRDEMTAAFPSLPQKAGRAFQALRAHREGKPSRIVYRHLEETTGRATISGTQRSVRILGVANPQIDHYRLARALLALERDDTDGKLLAKAKKMAKRRGC